MKIKVHMKRKRETIDRDFCEAAFHGKFWSRCRSCGKAYESYSVYDMYAVSLSDGKKYEIGKNVAVFPIVAELLIK